jgi:hypothetical protein
LRNHGVVVADDAGEEFLAALQLQDEVIAHLVFYIAAGHARFVEFAFSECSQSHRTRHASILSLFRYTKVMRFFYALLFTALWAHGQVNPPIYEPQGAGVGLPVPSWLRGTRTITGHIAGIDPGKILVNTLDDVGNVMFNVDEKTKVHVDKQPLTLADLQEGDPVAVKLKEIKGKGPYALEIMPHPDVLKRKQEGGLKPPPPRATPLPGTLPAEADNDKRAGAASVAAPADAAPTPARPSTRGAAAAAMLLTVPELPSGVKGLRGTIVALNSDEAQLQTASGERRKILVTSVTRIVNASNPAGTRDEIMEDVRVGDRVAIMGDSLEGGLYIAREILVNRPRDAQPQQAAPGESAPPVKAEALKGDFTGVVESIENEILKLRTPEGRARPVITTPITKIKKWNADTSVQAIRRGDELKVSGDVLEDGSTLAREITVTKAASSNPR